MVIFFSLLSFAVIACILINFMYIRIEIKNLKIRNNEKPDYNICLKFYLFNRIFIFNIKLKKEKLEKRQQKIGRKVKKTILLKVIAQVVKEEYKKRIYIEKFNLKSYIGTGEVISTVYLIPILSALIPVLSNFGNIKVNYSKFYYKIEPIFTDKFIVYISLNCIISLKFVHIIIAIIKFKSKIRKEYKKGKESDSFGKSSNRKFNDNCYE